MAAFSSSQIHKSVDRLDKDVSASSCKICLEKEAKYTCPRCNIGYCTVNCYQDEKHSRCSEAFYKDCVVNELQDMVTSPEDRKKMLEMLSKDLEERTNEEEIEQVEEDLAERIEGLDLDKEINIVWSRLTQKEKEEFAHMFQDGRLSSLIEIWTPWWRCAENMKAVKEIKVSHKGKSFTEIPEVIADIPDINVLLKNSRPSSDCKFDLINILFAYAFITRIHNGCHLECSVDSAQSLMNMSKVLKEQCKCGSVGEAVQLALDAVMQNSKNLEKSSDKFNLTVLEDVKTILTGPGRQNSSLVFLSAALSDIVLLFKAALKIVRKELRSNPDATKNDTEDLKMFKSLVFKAEKKVLFLLSWTQRYGMVMRQILPLLQFEIETRESAIGEVEEIKSAVEQNLEHLRAESSQTENKDIDNNCKIIELN